MNLSKETSLSDNVWQETGKIRIWHVDDSSIIRETVAELVGHVEPRFCFERQFASPDEVLDALGNEEQPDVILLDIQMGAHNGLDALRPIKLVAPHTRVLMLTTLGNPEAKARAKRDGASDFLLKSWLAEEIRSRILGAMSRTPAVPETIPQREKVSSDSPTPEGLPHSVTWVRGLNYIRSLFGLELGKAAER